MSESIENLDNILLNKLLYQPSPQLYKHFRGTKYQLLHIALTSDGEQPLAIYKALDTDIIWSRPVEEFFGKVEVDNKSIDRYELIRGEINEFKF
jgi:hypothetical protein